MNGDTLSGLDLGPTIRGFAAGQVVFERYRLDRILGRGGMGVVWLARDQELNEDIALKFLPEAVRLDAQALEELKRETRKSRKLTHRYIVRVYNFVSDANCAAITMEWIDGSTLSGLRSTRPNLVFEPAEMKPWVAQVCEALEYAHGIAKLIHRDLKPANIMVNAAGEAKMTDFGISSSLTESASRVSAQRSASGTLAYMSPQQALGGRPTVADDVYSLGATIYELISGQAAVFPRRPLRANPRCDAAAHGRAPGGGRDSSRRNNQGMGGDSRGMPGQGPGQTPAERDGSSLEARVGEGLRATGAGRDSEAGDHSRAGGGDQERDLGARQGDAGAYHRLIDYRVDDGLARDGPAGGNHRTA